MPRGGRRRPPRREREREHEPAPPERHEEPPIHPVPSPADTRIAVEASNVDIVRARDEIRIIDREHDGNHNSNTIKRMRDEASERGKLIDATQGRKTRSIIITDSDHIILSALQVETITQRFLLEK